MKGTRLFLIEFIINALVFALCAGVCAGIFAKADSNSTYAEALSLSIAEVQNVAEAVKSGGDPAELTGGQWRGSVMYIGYDAQFERTDPSSAVYLLTCRLTQSPGLTTAAIVMAKGGSELFSLNVSRCTNMEVTP